ncbi:hypothetical protein ElyMa_000169400 [Elysia marginata]|uniref:Uncharacterized protein n=1 Tax=Elysia marginata TaxID=1093978 RepID=A0AAV4ESS7_9GAST|nr:hypothetical protein ElyMa_000169400 [Elysia marginata]
MFINLTLPKKTKLCSLLQDKTQHANGILKPNSTLKMEEEESCHVGSDFESFFLGKKPDVHQLSVKEQPAGSDLESVHHSYEEAPILETMPFTSKSKTTASNLENVILDHPYVKYSNPSDELEEKPCIKALRAAVEAYAEKTRWPPSGPAGVSPQRDCLQWLLTGV